MELLSLDGVVEKGVFEIPSYQRGYAWQVRQLKDFWNDLEHVSKLGNKFHYMHSLTLRGLENELEDSAFEIIDRRPATIGYKPDFIKPFSQDYPT
ncbi:hypothetical protein HpDR134_12490 [Helicobacter pylori]